jgi:enolase-phosphatase E1
MAIILTDIEGTTSSISFVKEVLFPYAMRALPEFVARRGHEPEVRQWLDAARRDISGAASDAQIVAGLQQWIIEDRKHTALKALQGLIWQDGYGSGEFRAHLYPDAATALRRWQQDGETLYVYSSGSVAAQKLFFQHSAAGDLLPLFSGHFDTGVGAKREADSYRQIALQLAAAPAAITFLSDVVEELDAARDAGMQTVLVDRIEDYPTPRLDAAAHGHVRVTGFDAIRLIEPQRPR